MPPPEGECATSGSGTWCCGLAVSIYVRRGSPTEPAFLELREIAKCEAVILVRRS